MQESEKQIEEFSFKKLFVPLTTLKAIRWIIFIGLMAFLNSLFNGFVLDDDWQITTNTIVHSLANISIFFSGSTFTTGGAALLVGNYYRPIMSVYFSLVYTLFGATPFFYHSFQIILHIINTILIFLVLKKFFNKDLSFFLALIFLVHPINQEAAVYVSDIQDILFFLFGMSALLLSMNRVLTTKRTVLIYLFLILSVFSKETGIIFAPFIIFASWLERKRVSRYHILIPIICITGFYIIFRFFILHLVSDNGVFPMINLTLSQRMLSVPAILFYYISTFFYPQNLTVEQLWTVKSIDFQHFYLPLLLDMLFFILVGILGIYTYKKNKKNFHLFLFFLGWFILGISLYIQIIPLEMTVATRWMYFPIVGLLGLLGLTIRDFKLTRKNIQQVGYGLTVILILALSVRTIVRNTDWYNAFTLYNHDIQTEDNFALENDLGSEFFKRGQYDLAYIHTEKSVKMLPYWSNLYNLATIYYKTGQYSRAIDIYKSSLKNSDYYLSYENLSNVFLFTGNISLAEKYSKIGLSKLPYDATLWYIYGLSEYRLGNRQMAIDAIQRSLNIDNTNSQAIAVLHAIENNQQINFNN